MGGCAAAGGGDDAHVVGIGVLKVAAHAVLDAVAASRVDLVALGGQRALWIDE
jgi:hypothetical protein